MSLSEMDRRSFLGAVIGTSLATGLPFIATAAEPKIARVFPNDKDATAMLIEFINAAPAEQLRYNFFLMLDLDLKDIIYGARIKHVEQDSNSRKVVVTPESIEMRRDLTVYGFIFAKPDKTLIKPCKYACFQTLYGPSWVKDKVTGRQKLSGGDTLKHTYTLNLT